jgi:tRNA-2-methylthio-N6-dimethylallyladenosine synthase
VKPIVDAIDSNPNLCNHVHLPVQSGSSRVLEGMLRLYTRDQYMEKMGWIKNARRPIAITSDIIVGFPGETEKDFEETLSLLEEIQYDSIFSFKYSPRPNTAALQMRDHIPEEEKSRRLTIVQEKQRAIQIRRNAALIGAVEEVNVEGFHAALGLWAGRTSRNRTLNFTHAEPRLGQQNGEELIGRYVHVRVTRGGPNSLAGETVD